MIKMTIVDSCTWRSLVSKVFLAGKSIHGVQAVGLVGVVEVQDIRAYWWQWLSEVGKPWLSLKGHHGILVDENDFP